MIRNLITGGAGFIGANLAARLLRNGQHVAVFDNLSRPGCRHNIAWLRQLAGPDLLEVIESDVRDYAAISQACRNKERIFHLAGQVAVTTSVCEPRLDFETNCLGSFNVLEAARLCGHKPTVFYASTNKVYGALPQAEVAEISSRFVLSNMVRGVAESYPLDFHSPYGCSKGSSDQYFLDYARIYGLPTVVFRQSCIYGPRQFGVEDQGWMAWFIAAALRGLPITIYGNGKQVRDILYIDDLLDAIELAVNHIDRAAGQVYNIGGGPEHTLSIWAEFGPLLEQILQRPLTVQYQDPRPGDQRIFVSDITKAQQHLGWRPVTNVRDGTQKLADWIRENLNLFSHLA